MTTLETENVILQPFSKGDIQDVGVLSEDWKNAPGPAWDKWPTGEAEAEGMTDLFAKSPDKYLAIKLKKTGNVVGLIAINGFEEDGRMDLGHVIHSGYQDNRLDLEALSAVVTHLFSRPEVASIITKNADHPPQLAPLRALGFQNVDPQNGGMLAMTKEDWQNRS